VGHFVNTEITSASFYILSDDWMVQAGTRAITEFWFLLFYSSLCHASDEIE